MPSHPHDARPERILEVETGHFARKMFDLPYADLSPAQQLDMYWLPDGF